MSERGRGEIFEGIGFQFCKVATVALIAGKWVIPLSAGLCAGFFVLAYANGQRSTRCVLRHPLLVAAFYGIVSVVSLALMLRR